MVSTLFGWCPSLCREPLPLPRLSNHTSPLTANSPIDFFSHMDLNSELLRLLLTTIDYCISVGRKKKQEKATDDSGRVMNNEAIGPLMQRVKKQVNYKLSGPKFDSLTASTLLRTLIIHIMNK